MEKLRDNYRIPTIDEFVDGFEFEVYSEGYFEDGIEDFSGWYKYKFGYNNWRDIEEIQRELELGNIQVWCGSKIIESLKKLDNKKLAEFWCYFNIWEYPPELDNLKPDNWELFPTQIKYKINKPIIKYIKSRVCERELLREWNKDRFKGVEFDIWYENRQPLSDLAKELMKAMYKLENSNLN